MTLSQQLTEAKAVLKELWERRPTDPNFLVLGDRIRKVLGEEAGEQPKAKPKDTGYLHLGKAGRRD